MQVRVVDDENSACVAFIHFDFESSERDQVPSSKHSQLQKSPLTTHTTLQKIKPQSIVDIGASPIHDNTWQVD